MKSRLAADYHSLPRPLRSKLEALARLAEVLLTRQLQVRRLSDSFITGNYMFDVFGGLAYVAKTTNHLCLRGYVLDAKFGPKYDLTKPLFSTEFDKTSSLGNVSQE